MTNTVMWFCARKGDAYRGEEQFRFCRLSYTWAHVYTKRIVIKGTDAVSRINDKCDRVTKHYNSSI